MGEAPSPSFRHLSPPSVGMAYSNAPEIEACNAAGAGGGVAPAPSKGGGSDQIKRLQAVLESFEISIAEANELVILEDYEIVIIADDSGSMQRAAAPAGQRKLGEKSATRWDELKDTVSALVDLAVCFDESGVDVFFLNRGKLANVKSSSDPQFVKAFSTAPTGSTPLTETLGLVATKCAGERPVLLFCLTDGEPNGGAGPFKQAVRSMVQRPGPKIRMQIMACTSNDDEIGWLNVLDKELAEVDVTDDYFSEKAEVLRAGLVPKFSRGDWVMKAMLGPVSRKFDMWDEQIKGKGSVSQECNLCSIM